MLKPQRRDRRAGGPKTAAGKARSAQNARKHGLDRSAALDPAFADEINRLAGTLAGPDPSPQRRAIARAAAVAEVDLRRVARARHQVLNAAWVRRRPATRDLIKAAVRLQSRTAEDDARLTTEKLRPRDPMAEAASARRLVAELFALERYERRAFSRRQRALNALAPAPSAAPDADADAHEHGDAGPPAAPAPTPGATGADNANLAERTCRAHDVPVVDGAPTAGSNPGDRHVMAEQTPPVADDSVPGPDAARRAGFSPPPSPLDPDVDASELVASLAFAGVDPKRIARRLNLTVEELEARYGHALEIGPDLMLAQVARSLFDGAVGGDTKAGIFLMKTRGGWRENGPVRGPPGPTPAEQAKKQELVAQVMKMLERRQAGDGPMQATQEGEP